MPMSLRALVLFALVPLFANCHDFLINTPTNVVVCQTVLIQGTRAEPPFVLSVVPGGQPTASPLVLFKIQVGSSFLWTVDIPAGASVALTIKDANDRVAQSAPFMIHTGTNTDCLN
ncbi:MAG: hypothetical protein J3R72DRAFT_393006 [Linnemannia gamsii]|nr:MAG: hypothetical protein J3R72DRAFT_393006 [Linnemannia gamsii]